MLRKKLLKIINHYGVMKQLKYFQTEVFELNEAIIRAEEELRTDGFLSITEENKEHIAEEIADVMVILEQLRLHYEISIEEVGKIFKSKVERQLERIKNENEEVRNGNVYQD